MSIEIGGTYSLMDREGRMLGKIDVKEKVGEFLCGTLDKSADFRRYETLFKDFEECVNHQLFITSRGDRFQDFRYRCLLVSS